MLEDAQNTIFSNIVNHWAVTGSIHFTKSGKISARLLNESEIIKFNSLLSIVELLEAYDESKYNNHV